MINYLANPNRFLNFIKPIEFSIGVFSFFFIFIGLYVKIGFITKISKKNGKKKSSYEALVKTSY